MQIHTFKKACAAVYPSCEQNGIVWFWPSTEPQYKDILAKEKPPYIQELDDPSYTRLFGIREIPYGYAVLLLELTSPDNNLYGNWC